MFCWSILLTHLSRREFPTLLNWTSPFSFKGLERGIFHFYSREHSVANTGDPDQTPLSAASDLGLHCFPRYMSHKKDARCVILCVNP